jgi:hypothetical protein
MAFKGENGDKEDQSKQNPSGSTPSKKVKVVAVTAGRTATRPQIWKTKPADSSASSAAASSSSKSAATATPPPSLPGTPSPGAASSSAATGTTSATLPRQPVLPTTAAIHQSTRPPRPAASGPRQPAPSTALKETAKQTAHLGGSPVPGHRTPQPYTPAPLSTQVGDDASPVSSPSAHSTEKISKLRDDEAKLLQKVKELSRQPQLTANYFYQVKALWQDIAATRYLIWRTKNPSHTQEQVNTFTQDTIADAIQRVKGMYNSMLTTETLQGQFDEELVKAKTKENALPLFKLARRIAIRHAINECVDSEDFILPSLISNPPHSRRSSVKQMAAKLEELRVDTASDSTTRKGKGQQRRAHALANMAEKLEATGSSTPDTPERLRGATITQQLLSLTPEAQVRYGKLLTQICNKLKLSLAEEQKIEQQAKAKLLLATSAATAYSAAAATTESTTTETNVPTHLQAAPIGGDALNALGWELSLTDKEGRTRPVSTADRITVEPAELLTVDYKNRRVKIQGGYPALCKAFKDRPKLIAPGKALEFTISVESGSVTNTTTVDLTFPKFNSKLSVDTEEADMQPLSTLATGTVLGHINGFPFADAEHRHAQLDLKLSSEVEGNNAAADKALDHAIQLRFNKEKDYWEVVIVDHDKLAKAQTAGLKQFTCQVIHRRFDDQQIIHEIPTVTLQCFTAAQDKHDDAAAASQAEPIITRAWHPDHAGPIAKIEMTADTPVSIGSHRFAVIGKAAGLGLHVTTVKGSAAAAAAAASASTLPANVAISIPDTQHFIHQLAQREIKPGTELDIKIACLTTADADTATVKMPLPVITPQVDFAVVPSTLFLDTATGARLASTKLAEITGFPFDKPDHSYATLSLDFSLSRMAAGADSDTALAQLHKAVALRYQAGKWQIRVQDETALRSAQQAGIITLHCDVVVAHYDGHQKCVSIPGIGLAHSANQRYNITPAALQPKPTAAAAASSSASSDSGQATSANNAAVARALQFGDGDSDSTDDSDDEAAPATVTTIDVQETTFASRKDVEANGLTSISGLVDSSGQAVRPEKPVKYSIGTTASGAGAPMPPLVQVSERDGTHRVELQTAAVPGLPPRFELMAEISADATLCTPRTITIQARKAKPVLSIATDAKLELSTTIREKQVIAEVTEFVDTAGATKRSAFDTGADQLVIIAPAWARLPGVLSIDGGKISIGPRFSHALMHSGLHPGDRFDLQVAGVSAGEVCASDAIALTLPSVEAKITLRGDANAIPDNLPAKTLIGTIEGLPSPTDYPYLKAFPTITGPLHDALYIYHNGTKWEIRAESPAALKKVRRDHPTLTPQCTVAFTLFNGETRNTEAPVHLLNSDHLTVKVNGPAKESAFLYNTPIDTPVGEIHVETTAPLPFKPRILMPGVVRGSGVSQRIVTLGLTGDAPTKIKTTHKLNKPTTGLQAEKLTFTAANGAKVESKTPYYVARLEAVKIKPTENATGKAGAIAARVLAIGRVGSALKSLPLTGGLSQCGLTADAASLGWWGPHPQKPVNDCYELSEQQSAIVVSKQLDDPNAEVTFTLTTGSGSDTPTTKTTNTGTVQTDNSSTLITPQAALASASGAASTETPAAAINNPVQVRSRHHGDARTQAATAAGRYWYQTPGGRTTILVGASALAGIGYGLSQLWGSGASHHSDGAAACEFIPNGDDGTISASSACFEGQGPVRASFVTSHGQELAEAFNGSTRLPLNPSSFQAPGPGATVAGRWELTTPNETLVTHNATGVGPEVVLTASGILEGTPQDVAFGSVSLNGTSPLVHASQIAMKDKTNRVGLLPNRTLVAGSRETDYEEESHVAVEFGAVDDGGSLLPWQQAANISVLNHKEAPIAGSVSANTTQSNSIDLDVVGAAVDPEGDIISLTGTPTLADPSQGTVAIVNGQIRFIPAEALNALPGGAKQSVTINYQITDGTTTVNAQAMVSVSGLNDSPLPGSVSVNTTQATSVDLDVIAAASDKDSGDIISLTGTPTLADPSQGTVAIVNGQIRFIPAEALNALPGGAKQSVTINYQITDGTTTVNAQAMVSVSGLNDSPLPGSVSVNTTQATSVDLDVIAAASDKDSGDIISLTGTPTLADPSQGTVAIVNGKLRFIPAEALNALPGGAKQSVTINYQITDGTTTVNAQAMVSVSGLNDSPLPGSVSVNTTQATSVDLDVIAAASDKDSGDIISLTGTPTLADPSQGTVAIVNGQIRFIPAEALNALPGGAKQSVTINYQITDGTTTVNATAAVNVIGTNDAPRFDIAYNTVLPKTSGNGTVINGTDILANVTDLDIDDSRGFAVTDFSLNGSTTVPDGVTLQYRITNTTPWTTIPALGGEAFVLPEAAQLRVVTNGTTVGNVTIKTRAYDGGKSATLEPLPSEPGGTSHFSGGDEAAIIQPLEAVKIVPPVSITTTGPVSYSDWADNAGNSKNPIANNMNISGLQPGKNYTFSLELTAYAKSGGGYSGFYPFTIPSGSALNDPTKFSFTQADNVRTYTFYGTPEQFDAVLPDMHITGFICFQTNFQATCSGSFDIANAQIQSFTFKIDDAGKVTSTTLSITSDPALVGGRRMEALAAAHTQLAPSNMSDKVSTTPATAAAVLRLWQEAEAVSGHKAAAVSKGVG